MRNFAIETNQLTTLDIPVFDLARQLVDMLLKTLAGEAVDSPRFVEPKLLIRSSTGWLP